MAQSKTKRRSKDYISVWQWMWILFVTWLPLIGLIMTVVWAFDGENETRKNYFRALLVWFAILIVVWVVILAVDWAAVTAALQAQSMPE